MNTDVNVIEISVLFIVSVLLFLAGVYYFFIHNRVFKANKHSFENRIMFFSAALLAATWCIRYMVGISGVLSPDGTALSRSEEILNSLVHTFQSFSMDEDYTEYLTQGKVLMESLFPHTGAVKLLYSAYVSVLNVICPIMGGAILFAILTSIFPKIKLWFFNFMYWRPICYFSELNDASLALAKSIRNSDSFFLKTLIVFLDVYTDSDDEEISERIQKAKFINAVCLKEDIADISISHRRGKKFFLIDEKQIGNLQTLAAFKSKKIYKRLKHNDEIYVFGTDESNRLVVESVRSFFEEQLGAEKPLVMSVNGMKNLVYDLLKNKPLFSAKIGKPRKAGEHLKIAVFGSGQIGTEMFLAAYWCGQLLDYKLHLTVISKEKEADFRARIDHINSDIFETSKEGSELLRVYEDEAVPSSPTYFSFSYVETDVRQDDLYTKMLHDGDGGRIVDSDYFVVALGSDEDNLDVADQIARYITLSKTEAPESRIPVAYVVYDDALSELLKSNCNEENPFVDMFPFGSLDDTYCCNNITYGGLSNSVSVAEDDIYKKAVNQKLTAMMTDIKEYGKKEHKDSYSYWSEIARVIHIKYKAFCVGKSADDYIKNAKDPNNELNRNHRLAWLEHRRWNAFMRVNGFKRPTLQEEESYIRRLPVPTDQNDFQNKGKHKNLTLKLHPCLVECAVKSLDNADAEQPRKEDLLDQAAIRMKEKYTDKNLGTGDFKAYDYPIDDYRLNI